MLSHTLSGWSLVVASLVPVTFLVAAPFASRRAPFRAAVVAAFVALGLALLAVTLGAASALRDGAAPVPPTMLRGLLELGMVSGAMLVLVCTLSVVVVRFSRTYLVGERGLVRYARSLLTTLASVTLLVLSNHLGLLVVAWLTTGIGLHQLLTFYPKRRQAVVVAHKKFLIARVADVCFFGSLVLIEGDVGSLHIDSVNAYAAATASLSPSLHLATVLLALGVLLRTAQLPFHGWILQVMEAPTPVSALLHAGVVNIGGFVMIRLAPLMARASIAQALLVGVGLVTAVVAALVMTTRPSVKVVLAWSTIAQMGFMLVQCGLGVWHLALLHLLAHSLYKAHAFLGSGSVVTTWRTTALVRPPETAPRSVLAGLLLLVLAAAPLYAAFRVSSQHVPASLAPLALALLLGLVPMIARALAAGGAALARAVAYAATATASYFALHALVERVAPPVAHAAASPLAWSVVALGISALFVVQTVLLVSPSGRLARTMQPHLHSGLYLDDWFTRLTFRVWPPRLERASSATSRRSSVTVEAR